MLLTAGCLNDFIFGTTYIEIVDCILLSYIATIISCVILTEQVSKICMHLGYNYIKLHHNYYCTL